MTSARDLDVPGQCSLTRQKYCRSDGLLHRRFREGTRTVQGSLRLEAPHSATTMLGAGFQFSLLETWVESPPRSWAGDRGKCAQHPGAAAVAQRAGCTMSLHIYIVLLPQKRT